jgi:death-on-curing protein
MHTITFLTVEQVIELHKSIIDRFGGAGYGIRDLGLLDSAVHQAEASVFGEYAHTSLYTMGAAYCFHILKNHPFVDGNKRTGLLQLLLFSPKIVWK